MRPARLRDRFSDLAQLLLLLFTLGTTKNRPLKRELCAHDRSFGKVKMEWSKQLSLLTIIIIPKIFFKGKKNFIFETFFHKKLLFTAIICGFLSKTFENLIILYHIF